MKGGTMKAKVGINGFGRIGRQVLKAIMERHPETLEVVAVNDLFDVKTNVHLFKYDTNYSHFPGKAEANGDKMTINGHTIRNFAQRDPRNIPWRDVGVDIVIEATGLFTAGPKARPHMEAGCQKVIITAPAKDVDLTVVMGVNSHSYDPAKHHIISNASCTTNCLAPVAKLIHDQFGIIKGLMVTIHSYTNDQRILDVAHKDLRRARAAACNIIPTSTGAAKAVGLVIPELQGKLDGYALRVPTPTVSVVDLVAVLKEETTTDNLFDRIKGASEGSLEGILGYEEESLVSTDYKGDSRSSIVDKEFTYVSGGNLAKVVCWYDNEWGYSCRVADLANFMVEKGL
jgi:glyceraldehyde 3-phosphate dehydrogenase